MVARASSIAASISGMVMTVPRASSSPPHQTLAVLDVDDVALAAPDPSARTDVVERAGCPAATTRMGPPFG